MQTRHIRSRLLGDSRRALCVGHLYAPPQTPQPPAPDPAIAARLIAAEIDSAIRRNHWSHADRLATQALRLAPHSPRLTETLARLRLAQNDLSSALVITETSSSPTASIRLLRNICLMQSGRKAEAHLDLHQWSRESTAPLQARVLLSILDWESGDLESASDALARNLRYLDDPHSLALLLLISRQRGLHEQVDHVAARLREASRSAADPAALELLLTTLNIPAHDDAREPSQLQVITLSVEILANEHLIPLLIQLQRVTPHAPSAALLYRSLVHILPELSDPVSALDALARLALQLGDLPAASIWAHRALELSPMSAALVLLTQQIESALDSFSTSSDSESQPIPLHLQSDSAQQQAA